MYLELDLLLATDGFVVMVDAIEYPSVCFRDLLLTVLISVGTGGFWSQL